MVYFPEESYPKESPYNENFEEFPFPLSDFQKYAIEAIEKDCHVLIGAHTGSGKTLPAEYAIQKFVAMGKKVIYTTPIKALSNQKYNDFNEKFSESCSFGILTGDIKANSEADCLIMTTEILRNTLFQKTMNSEKSENKIPLHFDMDIENELGCVIFDEVHYINDPDRGRIWEETIMMLPDSVLMVMLSATIDRPLSFAQWIERNKTKDVYLTQTSDRVVPLFHYSFITAPSSFIDKNRDKEFSTLFKENMNCLVPLKEKQSQFNETNFYKILKIIKYLEKNSVRVTRKFVLNEIVRSLKHKRMLPAICFVLSRKLCYQYANEISETLFDSDSKAVSLVKNECLHTLRKLPNHEEYIHLPEFSQIVKLMEKGVAVHHSGVLPIFKEMIEMMFAKGFVKLLFATETFAVGVNMPTKTVIFTGFQKFSGSGFRTLHSHEYTQMAGRAGRRGLDTIGHVIHLNNIMENPLASEYKIMLSGKPQTLTSKFTIEYNLILNLMASKPNHTIHIMDIITFTKKSMMNDEIDKELHQTEKEYENFEEKKKGKLLEQATFLTKFEDIELYLEKQEKMGMVKPKQRKRIQRELIELQDSNKKIVAESEKVKELRQLDIQIGRTKQRIININYYISNIVKSVIDIIIENKFVIVNEEDETLKLTLKGLVAANIQEVHGLSFADIIMNESGNILDKLSGRQIAALFSCFTNIKISDMFQDGHIKSDEEDLKYTIKCLQENYDKYSDLETNIELYTGYDYSITFDMVGPIIEWFDAEDEAQAKYIIKEVEQNKDIFIGEFIKVILKINNIATEFEKISELTGNLEFLQKCKEIHEKTLKFVASNQSLYV